MATSMTGSGGKTGQRDDIMRYTSPLITNNFGVSRKWWRSRYSSSRDENKITGVCFRRQTDRARNRNRFIILVRIVGKTLLIQ